MGQIRQIETEITQAVVYLHGGIVYRRGVVTLLPGQNRFYIVAPFQSIQENSIILDFQGKAQHVNYAMPQDIPADTNNEEQEEITQHTDQIDRIKEELEVCQFVKGKIQSIRIDQTDRQTEPKECLQAIQIFSDELIKNNEKIRQLKKRCAEEEQVLKRLRFENEKGQEQKRGLLVEAMVDMEGEAVFTLSYIEKKISWRPFYEINVLALNRPMRVTLRGKVLQQTGEDWHQTEISLVYGDMNQSNKISVLKPWELRMKYNSTHYDSFQSIPVGASAPMPPGGMGETTVLPASGISGMTAVLDRNSQRSKKMTDENWNPQVEQSEPMPSRIEKQTMVKYTMTGKYEVESGKEGMTLDIHHFDVPAEYQYYAIPKQDVGGFLTGEIGQLDSANLHECEARIYVRGVYVGETWLSRIREKGKHRISLGRDDRIETQWKQISRMESEARLAGKNSVSFVYELVVTNHMDETVKIVINDQIPKSEDKDILIKVDELTGGQLNEETGEVVWNGTMAAHGTGRFRVAFTVSYPKGKTIWNL